MTRLWLWVVDRRTLVRVADDAHRALRVAHHNVRVLQQRVADLEVDLADADAVSSCPGRREHLALAQRVHIAEAKLDGDLANVAPLRPVPLCMSEPRGGDPA